jgi:hypothetical protein
MTLIYEQIRTLYRSPDWSNVELAKELTKGQFDELTKEERKILLCIEHEWISRLRKNISHKQIHRSFTNYPTAGVRLHYDENTLTFSDFSVQFFSETSESWYFMFGRFEPEYMPFIEFVADFFGKVIELI